MRLLTCDSTAFGFSATIVLKVSIVAALISASGRSRDCSSNGSSVSISGINTEVGTEARMPDKATR